MKAVSETHSDRKHRSMVEAARILFLKQGYEGTSMEEIAVKAAVSKQTVYKHFADKKRLFEEIVLATTSQVDRVVGLVAGSVGRNTGFEEGPHSPGPAIHRGADGPASAAPAQIGDCQCGPNA